MLKNIAFWIIVLLFCLTLPACDSKVAPPVKPVAKKSKLSKLAQIKRSGTLHVLTHIAPNTYYPVTHGHAGLEYDLATLFAKQLGVKVQFHTAKNFTELLNKTAQSEFDITAAGLAVTESREKTVRFSTSYHEIVEQIIYRSGATAPQTLQDLKDGILEVVKDSSHVDSLKNLQNTVAPQLSWLTNSELDSEGLIALLNQGLIDYTVADSTQALLIQQVYPKLQIAFDISAPRQIAWALPQSTDDSLYNAVNHFLKKIKRDKTLAQLLERYYGHVESLDYVDKCKFYQHHQNRLPQYKPYFLNAAKQQNLDWRLLAAIGYQESHWENSAVSPTGVRGIMMLTGDTALQVGIKDRTDPTQSITGGAMYFQQQLEKIPVQIPEPDRTWFALAAYNIGYGHLDDARLLTRQQKRNPDKWLDVKETLPLLENDYWFMQTKHGYARGNEPVIYVENVRNYYDLLVWLSTNKSSSDKIHPHSFKQRVKLFLQNFLDWAKKMTQQVDLKLSSLAR